MPRKCIAAVLLLVMIAQPFVAEATTWNKVRYNGGPVQTKVDPKDWGHLKPRWISCLTNSRVWPM